MKGSAIVAMRDEVLEHAELTKRSMPTEELSGWAQLGDAPILAKAALSYAHAVAAGQIDVEREFARILGPRRWSILQTAIGKRR